MFEYLLNVLELVSLWLKLFPEYYLQKYDDCLSHEDLIYEDVNSAISMSGYELLKLLKVCSGADEWTMERLKIFKSETEFD